MGGPHEAILDQLMIETYRSTKYTYLCFLEQFKI